MDELTHADPQSFDMQIACYRNRTTLDTAAEWASCPKFHTAYDDHPDSYWSRYTHWQVATSSNQIVKFVSSNNIFDADQQMTEALKEREDGYDVVILSTVYQNMLENGTGLEDLSPEYLAWKYRGFGPAGKDFKIPTQDDTPPPARMYLPENPMVETFRQKLSLVQDNFAKSHSTDELADIRSAMRDFFGLGKPRQMQILPDPRQR